MENIKKENPECGFFENLTYRHENLLAKLSEVEGRLSSANIKLGGEYPLKDCKGNELEINNGHIGNYMNQLNSMEDKLVYMFSHIERLEHLVQ